MDNQAAIYQVVANIPKGRVCSYGEVASKAGLPGYARYVGYTLKHLPAGSTLPWHRVVNAKGKISFPVGSAQFERQRQLLVAEGVLVNNGTIKLKTYRW